MQLPKERRMPAAKSVFVKGKRVPGNSNIRAGRDRNLCRTDGYTIQNQAREPQAVFQERITQKPNRVEQTRMGTKEQKKTIQHHLANPWKIPLLLKHYKKMRTLHIGEIFLLSATNTWPTLNKDQSSGLGVGTQQNSC